MAMASVAPGNGQLSWGGAALLEIAVTTRLAFIARGDVSIFELGSTEVGSRSTAHSVSLGLAVY
jgi:hypothetical protein